MLSDIITCGLGHHLLARWGVYSTSISGQWEMGLQLGAVITKILLEEWEAGLGLECGSVPALKPSLECKKVRVAMGLSLNSKKAASS